MPRQDTAEAPQSASDADALEQLHRFAAEQRGRLDAAVRRKQVEVHVSLHDFSTLVAGIEALAAAYKRKADSEAQP